MVERLRQTANNFEAKRFPKCHGPRIRAYYEVELHSAIALLSGVIQRVLAHHAGHAATGCCWACHVAAIADVASAAPLIRSKIICADDLACLFSDERLPIIPKPIRQSFSFGHLAI